MSRLAVFVRGLRPSPQTEEAIGANELCQLCLVSFGKSCDKGLDVGQRLVKSARLLRSGREVEEGLGRPGVCGGALDERRPCCGRLLRLSLMGPNGGEPR